MQKSLAEAAEPEQREGGKHKPLERSVKQQGHFSCSEDYIALTHNIKLSDM